MKFCEGFVPTNVEPATKMLPQQRLPQQLHRLVLTDTTFGAGSTFGDAAGAQESGEIVGILVDYARAKMIKLGVWRLLFSNADIDYLISFPIWVTSA